MRPSWRSGRMLTAVLMTVICAGCATSGALPPPVHLPDAPGQVFQPVEIADPKPGSSAKAALAVCTAGLATANDRIRDGGSWYQNLRELYSRPSMEGAT